MCNMLNRDPYRLSYRLRSCAIPDILIKMAIFFSATVLEIETVLLFFEGDLLTLAAAE